MCSCTLHDSVRNGRQFRREVQKKPSKQRSLWFQSGHRIFHGRLESGGNALLSGLRRSTTLIESAPENQVCNKRNERALSDTRPLPIYHKRLLYLKNAHYFYHYASSLTVAIGRCFPRVRAQDQRPLECVESQGEEYFIRVVPSRTMNAVNAPHQKTKSSRVFELHSEFGEARQAPRQIGHRLHAYSLKNVALWHGREYETDADNTPGPNSRHQDNHFRYPFSINSKRPLRSRGSS